MPTTKSAKKRLRQSIARRTRNRAVKRAVKTQYRKVSDEIGQAAAEALGDETRLAAKKLDQAAAQGALHRNAAARLKSRLAAKAKAAKAKTG